MVRIIFVLLLLSSTVYAKSESICDEVVPNLYIGGTNSLQYAMKKNIIDRVVSFGNIKGCYHKSHRCIKILKLDMPDSHSTNILFKFDKIYRFIDNSKTGVLVHCAKGHSRSASIVIAYLMKKYSIRYEHAFKFLKKARPSVNPNKSFKKQLKNYEKELCKK